MRSDNSQPQNEMDKAETRSVLGVKITSTDMEEVLLEIQWRLMPKWPSRPKERPFWIVTANPEIVLAASEDAAYKNVINSADLVVADGVGLRLAAAKLKIVRGRELVEKLLGQGYKVFFLGGQGGVAQKMVDKYGGEASEGSQDIKSEILNPNSQINTNDQILNRINKYKPDILLVAYGAPWQEKWIEQNLDKLDVKVVMGVGGTFDYLTDKTVLPPKWMAAIGMEWLWRALHDPKHWKRVWRAVVVFPWKVFRSKMSQDKFEFTRKI